MVKEEPRREISPQSTKPHAQKAFDSSKVKTNRTLRSSGKANMKGPSKWVPKDKLIYFADVLGNSTETHIRISSQWRLTTHRGRKAYGT